MTGGSLGLRTGSYGSLQQHLQNSVVLPIQTTPTPPNIGRKPSKMLLSGPREKERFLHWLCKVAIRRRVVMPLLVLVSIAVFITLMSAISKDEDAPGVSDAHSLTPRHFKTVGPPIDIIVSNYHASPLVSGKQDNERYNNSVSLAEAGSVISENKTLPLPPVVHSAALPPVHPCKNFAVPPPPADRKRTGPRPCPVCYLPVELAIAFMPTVPSVSPVLRSLTYVSEEPPISPPPLGGSPFGGYPSLKQRNDSFDIKENMNVHCGFVRGNRPGHQTGFDIDEADLLEMEHCYGIVVASAIFGNYDLIQQPTNITKAAKKNVCFYMFVDGDTKTYLKNSSMLDGTNRVGLWRVVVVHNLRYADARRNGKVEEEGVMKKRKRRKRRKEQELGPRGCCVQGECSGGRSWQRARAVAGRRREEKKGKERERKNEEVKVAAVEVQR